MKVQRVLSLAASVISVCLIICSSCNQPKGDIHKHGFFSSDSSMIDIESYQIKTIYVGEKISNDPLSSQLVKMDQTEKYMMLDESKIYIFDWDSGVLEDSISLEEYGPLTNYSGFTYISNDSILVYNYNKRTLFMVNNQGHCHNHWRIPEPKDFEKAISSVEAINASRIQFNGSNILLSGSTFGGLSQAKGMNIPYAETLDLGNAEIMAKAFYPATYTDKNWGIQYLNMVFSATDDCNNFIFSLPIMDKLFRYDKSFSKCDTLISTSRYDKGIASCDYSIDELDEDITKEISYYISQTTYGSVYFDFNKNLYYRFADHPIINWDKKSNFVKPISILVIDKDGNLINESGIIRNVKLLSGNTHVSKDGIAIALDSQDEDVIQFAVFKVQGE